MAHEITIRENGVTEFFCAKEQAWHGLTTPVPANVTAAEAIKLANLDWSIEEVPCLHQMPDGTLHKIEGKKVMRRADNGEVLSVMSDKYKVIQNAEAFDFMDSVVGEGQAVWNTAGSLFGGRRIFANLELEGDLFVKNDPTDTIKKNILITNTNDGTGALLVMVAGIRTVCWNTCNANLKAGSQNMLKIYHRSKFAEKKADAQKALGLALAYYDEFQEAMNQLAAEQVSSSYVEGFINALIPAEKDAATGKTAKRTLDRRDQIDTLFRTGKGNNGETKWDLFNAVTEYVDHHSNGRLSKETKLEGNDEFFKMEQRFDRAIFGTGAVLKQRAMDLLLN
jgi:phage/plasmid-like protein (TIGR03299 family)